MEAEEIVATIVRSLKDGGKVLTFGVGGNAATAIHFSAELSGKYEKFETPLPCICLSENPSVITAITNDFGWEHVFERQIQALGKKGDIVFALSISTSGKYLVNALLKALSLGCQVILICGKSNLDFKSTEMQVYEFGTLETPWVQEEQLILIHKICEGVKSKF